MSLVTFQPEVSECAFWGCKENGAVWIGDDEHRRARYVCEPHLQHTAETASGTVMFRSLKKARSEQLRFLEGGANTER